MTADISEIPDRQETVSLMEPMRISEGSRHRVALTDLAVDLAAHAAGFRRSLPEGVLAALANLVRAMNCYYSNLIEGHDTHRVRGELILKPPREADKVLDSESASRSGSAKSAVWDHHPPLPPACLH